MVINATTRCQLIAPITVTFLPPIKRFDCVGPRSELQGERILLNTVHSVVSIF